MNLAVVIPVKGQVPLTRSILTQLKFESFDRCYISDNQDFNAATLKDPPTWETADLVHDLEHEDERFRWYAKSGFGITHQWNSGWRRALADLGPDTAVLFLNNDVTISPGTLAILRRVLVERDDLWVVGPDYDSPAGTIPHGRPRVREVKGTYRTGGIPGWAFAVRPGVQNCIDGMFDERFVWWCSDDQLVERVVRAGGKIGIVRDLGLDHMNEGTASAYPELHQQKHVDLLLYEQWKNGKA